MPSCRSAGRGQGHAEKRDRVASEVEGVPEGAEDPKVGLIRAEELRVRTPDSEWERVRPERPMEHAEQERTRSRPQARGEGPTATFGCHCKPDGKESNRVLDWANPVGPRDASPQ